MNLNHLDILLNADSDSAGLQGLEWEPRFCIANRLTSNVGDAAATLRVVRVRSISSHKSSNKLSGVTALPGDLVCISERYYSCEKINQASLLCPCGAVY